MRLDLDKIKRRLADLEGGGSDDFWKPQDPSSTVVRVVPLSDDPFYDYHIHYRIGVGGPFLCPKRNFNESCAVCDFARTLWDENTDESKEEARKFSAKHRFYVPVYVRGEEDKGVRLWGFSKTVYEDLLKLCLNPEYSDFMHPTEGVDLTIDYGKRAGKRFPETTINPKRKSSKLESSDKKIKELLSREFAVDQLFSRISSDNAKKRLTEQLSPNPEIVSSDEIEKGGDNVTPIDKAFDELKKNE